MHRFDGLTGEPLWSVGFDARPEAKGLNMSGGVYSTPVLGRGSLQDRVFVSVAEVGALGAGLLLALDKQTGAELWRLELEHHAWSTPVVVYDEQDHGYLILGDTAGDVTLYDAHSGEQLHRLALGYLIEASPAFMDGVLVLPVRGRHVYGIALR
jgi:outer membrane protein assembly factor BamB